MERLSEVTRNSLFELLALVNSLTNSMSQELQTDNKSTGDYNLMLKPIIAAYPLIAFDSWWGVMGIPRTYVFPAAHHVAVFRS